jgi:fermentation-respiration switch protein FrsA (DUF1100 family)
VVAVVAGCSLVSLDRLVFFPDPDVPAPPPGVEERWISTADGVRLHAWWVSPPGATTTLVWSHGNAGNIGGRADALLALAGRGLAVLAYDYRSFGRSGGQPSEDGVYRDAEAAYDSLGEPGGRVVCFGESLGGAVTLHLATVRPCAAVVLVSTFTSLRDVARFHYGPAGLLAGHRFDSLARIARVRVPVLIAHGDRDEVVPFVLGERLFAAANEPRRFLRVPGAHHNDVFASAELLDVVAEFARTRGGGA